MFFCTLDGILGCESEAKIVTADVLALQFLESKTRVTMNHRVYNHRYRHTLNSEKAKCTKIE